MVSPPNSTTFSNKKPKLLGDNILSNTILQGTVEATNANLDAISGSVRTIASPSFTVTKPKNKIYLRISCRVSNSAFVRIKEGAVLLAEGGGSGSGTRSTEITLTDVSIGAHVYTCTCEQNVLIFQVGQNGFSAGDFIGKSAFGIMFESDDTHDTKNTNVISG